MRQIPYVMAMVVCDAIWKDPATRKNTLLGLFSAIGATKFPVVQPIIAVYAALTDGLGETELRVTLESTDEEDTIAEQSFAATFETPLVVLELNVMFENVTFPKPGEYRFKIMCGDDPVPLMTRRLVVMDLGRKQNDEDTAGEAG